MTADIIPLEQFERARGSDDARFLGCPDCGGEDWAVVCRFASGNPFVASLICTACHPVKEIGVLNGFLE